MSKIDVNQNNTQLTDIEFNTKLFIARKIAENEIYNSVLHQKNYFYFSSLHNRTLIYKGLLMKDKPQLQ